MVNLVVTVLWVILCSVHSKGAISNLTVETTSNSMTISWAFPQDMEEDLSSFRVTTRYVGPCTSSIPSVQVSSINRTVRLALIDFLEEFSTYNITIDGISMESTILHTATTVAETRPTRPPPIQNFRITQVTPTTVSLQWDDIPCLERNSRFLEYRIHSYLSNDIFNRRTLSSQVPPYTITGLIPDTEYSFMAYVAYFGEDNRLYQGGHTNTIMTHTQSILVMINFTQVESQPSSISLTWSSSVEPESVALLQYEISAYYVGPCRENSFPETRVVINNPSITAYSLQNLEEFSTYEVMIIAVAENGVTKSINATATTLGDGAIKSVAHISIMSIEADTTTITVAWNATVEPSCHMIVQYLVDVQYRGPCEEDDFEDKTFIISNSSIRHHQVIDLEELSLYEVEITMTLEDGRVDSSSTLIATQGEFGGNPSITSVLSNPTSATIGWKKPLEVCVERYEITATYAGPCSEVPFPELHNITILSSEEFLSTNMPGLRPFSYYNFSIIAINLLSSSSATVTVRTGSLLPGEPTSLEVSSITETTADLSWQHSCLDHHTNIAAYVITYGLANSFPEQAEVTNVSATVTSYQLNGLEPGSQYTVQVYAVSENIGPGMKSDLIQITTNLDPQSNDGTKESSTSNLSNSSVVVALIVVSALVILGLLLVAVICIGVVGAIYWKRNSRNVAFAVSDGTMELEECSAYGNKNITPGIHQECEHHSCYQHYESLHSVDNPNYEYIKPVQDNATYNSLIRQADDDSSNNGYNSLDRLGGTVQNSTGEFEENFNVITNDKPN